MNDKAVSKVLVLDNSTAHAPTIKDFCERNDLVPLKVRKESVAAVLRTNVDLGAILYSETYGETLEETLRIVQEIRGLRPELPIILRREKSSTLEDLPAELRAGCCRAYTADDLGSLKAAVDQYIFSLIYPNALLRGISEIMDSVLAGQFPVKRVSFDTPYIVHDRIIFGEVLSVIQLESNWCRGYMMLQTEERAFLDLTGESHRWRRCRAVPAGERSPERGDESRLGCVQEPLHRRLDHHRQRASAGSAGREPPAQVHLVRHREPAALLPVHADRPARRQHRDAVRPIRFQPQLVAGRLPRDRARHGASRELR